MKTELDLLTEIHTDVKWLKTEILGNGSKGLIAKCEANTKFRYVTMGALGILSALMTYGIISIKHIIK